MQLKLIFLSIWMYNASHKNSGNNDTVTKNSKGEMNNTFLLLTEFEGRTVNYARVFPIDLWPKREARGQKSKWKNKGP